MNKSKRRRLAKEAERIERRRKLSREIHAMNVGRVTVGPDGRSTVDSFHCQCDECVRYGARR